MKSRRSQTHRYVPIFSFIVLHFVLYHGILLITTEERQMTFSVHLLLNFLLQKKSRWFLAALLLILYFFRQFRRPVSGSPQRRTDKSCPVPSAKDFP